MKFRTKIRIYSSYLALGSIILYGSLTRLGTYLWASKNIPEALLTDFAIDFLTPFIIAFVAGILMIITYYGFLHSKKYPRYTGISGCFFFILHDINYLSMVNYQFKIMEQLIAHIPNLLTMIASIILLILTLIYWKKLS